MVLCFEREGFGQEHFPTPLSAFESGFGQAFQIYRRKFGRTTLPRSRACGLRIGIRPRTFSCAALGFRIGIRSGVQSLPSQALPHDPASLPRLLARCPRFLSNPSRYSQRRHEKMRPRRIYFISLRRGRDSNPRYGYYPVWGISNPLLSAAQPPLLLF